MWARDEKQTVTHPTSWAGSAGPPTLTCKITIRKTLAGETCQISRRARRVRRASRTGRKYRARTFRPRTRWRRHVVRARLRCCCCDVHRAAPVRPSGQPGTMTKERRNPRANLEAPRPLRPHSSHTEKKISLEIKSRVKFSHYTPPYPAYTQRSKNLQR